MTTVRAPAEQVQSMKKALREQMAYNQVTVMVPVLLYFLFTAARWAHGAAGLAAKGKQD